jgi:hypothetical protein
MPGKRVQFDPETWQQIDLLGREQMKDFQELTDEAFRDLLKKHGRPFDLKDALRRSAKVSATIHPLRPVKATATPAGKAGAAKTRASKARAGHDRKHRGGKP